MDLTKFVGERETLGHIDRADFDFAFGVDANFIPPMGIMLTSLVENNPDYKFRIHIFLNSIFNEDFDKLKKFVAAARNIQLDIYRVDAAAFASHRLDCRRHRTRSLPRGVRRERPSDEARQRHHDQRSRSQ